MTQPFIHQLLQTFFQENQCDILENEKGKIKVQLNEQMDKTLMNRPFYWKYMEMTNQQGIPMEMTYHTTEEKPTEKGEWMTHGCSNLQQIQQYLQDQARFTRLFQKIDTTAQTVLHPWLTVNYRVSYEGIQKREKLYSIGLHLINGTFLFGMMEHLRDVPLHDVISHHCYTISPIIKPKSGFFRMEQYLDKQIEQEKHQWAIDSHQRLLDEIELINYFYKHTDEEEKLEEEINIAKKRFSPVIRHQVISGGLIFLEEGFMKKTSTQNE